MLNLNQIYNIDCRVGIQDIDTESIDLVVTDPPYLIDYKTNRRKDKTHRFCTSNEGDNNKQLIIDILPQIHRVLKNNTSFYCFCNTAHIDFFKQEIEKYFKIRNIIVWIKNNHTAGDLLHAYGKKYEFIIYAQKGKRPLPRPRITDVWQFSRVSNTRLLHANQKPIELIKQILNYSITENNIILDPFSGVATTAIAALELHQSYIGFEVDKDYFDTGNRRIEEKKKEIEEVNSYQAEQINLGLV